MADANAVALIIFALLALVKSADSRSDKCLMDKDTEVNPIPGDVTSLIQSSMAVKRHTNTHTHTHLQETDANLEQTQAGLKAAGASWPRDPAECLPEVCGAECRWFEGEGCKAVVMCGPAEGELDCKGNIARSTLAEDNFALKIIKESVYPYCAMSHIAKAYLYGITQTEGGHGYFSKAWGQSFVKKYNEVNVGEEYSPTSSWGSQDDCERWVEFFLDAEGMFKDTSDIVQCAETESPLCAEAMAAAQKLRGNQPIWLHDKGRVPADVSPPDVKISRTAGTSIGPCLECVDYFSKAHVHAKGLFTAAPAGNLIADNFRQCKAPFVAGTSGTMWVALRQLLSDPSWVDPKYGGEANGVCSPYAQIAQMQFGAHLVLGGHHSWTEVCIVLEQFYNAQCPEDSHDRQGFRGLCAVSTEALCKGADAYDEQMEQLESLWDDLKSKYFHREMAEDGPSWE